MKRPSSLPLVLIGLALIALGIGAFAYQNIGDAVAGIPESRLPKHPPTETASSTPSTLVPTRLTPSP